MTTARQKAHLRTALGLKVGDFRPMRRNGYDAVKGSASHEEWERLVEGGYAARVGNNDLRVYYKVTIKGCAEVGAAWEAA